MTTRFAFGRGLCLAAVGSAFWIGLATGPASAQQCVGDCSGDGMVVINEIITCVNIDLGSAELASCPACSSNGETVGITDLVKAVNNALAGCAPTPAATNTPEATATNTTGAVPTSTDTPVSTNTPASTNTPVSTFTDTPVAPTNTPMGTATDTPVGPTNTPASTATDTPASTATETSNPTQTPTVTPTTIPQPTCAITAAGRYTETTGPGELKVSTFAAFPFPAGSVTIQDVSAPDANCVSQTVIPYPGGLTTPVFCVPALGYTVQVVQTGCGVGVIDSNGGSDLTVDEKGDTSFTGGSCNTHQATCTTGLDSSGEVTVQVGDGTADTCSSGGTGNAMVSIPVFTTTWLSTNGCPDADMNDSGADDTIITSFPQTLDQTTDRATAEFNDNDADGCRIAGVGPAGPYTTNQLCTAAGAPYACCTGAGTGTCVGSGGVGTCVDFGSNTVTVAGGGTVFSSAAPLHDLLFTNILPSTISGPTQFLGATCDSPPAVNFTGSAQRCITAP